MPVTENIDKIIARLSKSGASIGKQKFRVIENKNVRRLAARRKIPLHAAVAAAFFSLVKINLARTIAQRDEQIAYRLQKKRGKSGFDKKEEETALFFAGRIASEDFCLFLTHKRIFLIYF